ncbi:N-acetylmuramoyl-L-alanine amidase [Anaerotignum lactatifermentans]|uniref:N-acetylmuramoyl-L-alanine amidase n=1 Tax=Anaerotignum lactatifermentans TaxID=160404 RepID=A0ABS2GCP6_9FIRM|nr:N-acetylmuramoyl-L-alanine amidase [Anaerotignum lactatifermentans]MBM6829880.1 N-acetylmuramoyl-L-alanine amidase [Anaerotignum lactatifermentans]MBM6878382.1 N-acetylmuramoyl-L-alanine amidase [Anaerotignum lactatifermentans]MBM6951537.1 N-acetylmuramoyl-L-alanine amidase [Anaerotignum lactatifermentans]
MKGTGAFGKGTKRMALCLLVAAGCVLGMEEAEDVMLPAAAKVIVLDAGHGGWDPGKTGRTGRNEAELNLAVTEKLAHFLEQGGATVYFTRVDENALGEKKREDMAERKTVANDSGADLLISIHQNAFPSSSAKGAQVFYHKNSEAGKLLAEYIQASLKERADEENTRQAKANGDYYVLRTTEIPAVLVECGFLSNEEEERRLNEEEYQERVAWAIYCGILEYFSQTEGGGGLQGDKKRI